VAIGRSLIVTNRGALARTVDLVLDVLDRAAAAERR
jgi:hypothetical protein